MSNTVENNKRIAKNTMMLYVRMLLVMIVSLYTSRIILKVLGVDDFGIYNVVGGIVTMFAFFNGSMSAATQRFLSYELGQEHSGQLQKIFSVAFSIHLLIAICVFLLAETLGLWFVHNKLNVPIDRMNAALWVYQCSVLSFVISITQVPYNAIIIAREKMNIYAYMSIVEVILKLLIVFLLFYISLDKLKVYAVLVLSVSVIKTIFYRFYSIRSFDECRLVLVRDLTVYKPLFSFASWNVLAHFALMGINQGQNILLNIFFGPVVNAARAVSFQVKGAIDLFVQNLVVATNPQIVKSYASNDLKYMFELIFQSSKYSFLLLLFFSIPLLIETEFILNMWLKEPPEYSVIFCKLIIINTLVDATSGTLGYAVLATGRVKKYQLIISFVLLFNLPLSYILFKSGFPPEYAFFVSILLSFIAFFVRLLLIKEMFDFSPYKYFYQVVGKEYLIFSIVFLLTEGLLRFLNYDGLLKCLFAFVFSFFFLILTIYSIGLNSKERIFFCQKIDSFIKKVRNKKTCG